MSAISNWSICKQSSCAARLKYLPGIIITSNKSMLACRLEIKRTKTCVQHFHVPSLYMCVCVCVNTRTCVSACVRDNSVAEGIQSPPPPWEIKALSAAQDVESEVIHTQGPGLPARGASALVSTSNSQSTQFTFKELGKKIENFALWNLFSAFCVLLANNASSYQTFWT